MTSEMARRYLALIDAKNMARGYCIIARCDRCRADNRATAAHGGLMGLWAMTDGTTLCTRCRERRDAHPRHGV